MKVPLIWCYDFHSCLIHDEWGRQLNAEKGRKSELKDESQKTSLFGKAACRGNTGECSGFDHSAMKSEVSSLTEVNWRT